MFDRHFERTFNSFDARGSHCADFAPACAHSFSDDSARRDNTACLLSLDTALAVSIFAALRLIIIRIARIAASIIVLVAAVVVARRSNTEPGMVPAH